LYLENRIQKRKQESNIKISSKIRKSNFNGKTSFKFYATHSTKFYKRSSE